MPIATARKLPALWLTLLVGWTPVVLGTVVAALTVLGQTNQLLNHALFLLAFTLGSIPLGVAQRRLWRHGTSWRRSVSVLLAFSLVLAFVSTTIVIWIATRVGSIPGRFQWHFVFGSMDIVWFVLIAFCAIYMVIGYYVSMQEERVRALAAAALTRDAELRALRYQLHPHFLFNTLNAISTLVVEQRTQDATRMLARLGDFLRATLEGSGAHEVTLAEELALTEGYLDIEKARLGERLAISMQIGPDTLRAAVPYLLLQPLVENAIRHGIAPRREGGHLEIRVTHAGERLHLSLCNDGIGALGKSSPGVPDSSSVGLRNVRERLERLYEHDHAFELTFADDGSCRVLIDLPFRRMVVRATEPPVRLT